MVAEQIERGGTCSARAGAHGIGAIVFGDGSIEDLIGAAGVEGGDAIDDGFDHVANGAETRKRGE